MSGQEQPPIYMHNSSQDTFLELYFTIQIPLMTLADHVLCSLSIGPPGRKLNIPLMCRNNKTVIPLTI
jgi:hypothetical protein